MTATEQPGLLEVTDLRVTFRSGRKRLEAIRGVDLTLARGGVLGVVGESGSGKSVSMMAIMGLLPDNAEVSGSVRLDGRELVGLSRAALQSIRGDRIAMIFQDPLSALNPVVKVGAQIAEAIRIHDRTASRSSALERAVELLELVSIPQPRQRASQYPHEFSGGMRQRAMIAMAVANDPELLVADEPTTALDVTVQAQIFDVLDKLRDSLGIGLIVITHDLGVIAGYADEVAVMYAGRLVEYGATREVFYRPHHPYTRGLLASLPMLHGAQERLYSIPGTPPSLATRPGGCAFHPRCEWRQDICRDGEPELRWVGQTKAACHFAHVSSEAASDARTPSPGEG